MRFTQAFAVQAAPGEVLQALIDVPLVASCLPGAELADPVTGGRHGGTLTTQLGPTSLAYQGDAWLEQVDVPGRTIRLVATGSEVSGAGSAVVTVDAAVASHEDGSRVELDLDLQIAGRPTRFGRGLLTDVLTELTEQFAARLDASLSDARTPAALAPSTAMPAPSMEPSAGSHVPAPVKLGVAFLLGMLVGVVSSSLLARARRRAPRPERKED